MRKIIFLLAQIAGLNEQERRQLALALPLFYPELADIRGDSAERLALASDALLTVWEDLERLIRSRFESDGRLQPEYISGATLAEYGVMDERKRATYDEIRLVVDEISSRRPDVTYDAQAIAAYVRDVRSVLASEHPPPTLRSTLLADVGVATSAAPR